MSGSNRMRALAIIAAAAVLAWLGWRLLDRTPVREPDAPRHFYGQFGQDKWVLETVFPGVTDGYFVDIGCGDGVRASNSKALEDSGWSGLAIDPFPTNWEGRTCRLFKEVVYSKKGEVVEFRRAETLGGIDEHIEMWADKVRPYPVVKLTTTTIGDLLQRAKAPEFIHYLSLDVEGAEYEVLRVFPFEEFTVGAFTIEHNFEEPKRSQIRALLESHGYAFVREREVEDWYVRSASPTPR